MDTVNSRVLHVFVAIGLLFACLAGYLTWFEVQGKNNIMSSTYNRRLLKEEEKTMRGKIIDRSGTVLAHSEVIENKQLRLYPYANLYAHVIGYDSPVYGKSLLEARYNDQLLGRGQWNVIDHLGRMLSDDQRTGNDVVLTIDHELQEKAKALLGKKNGAVVAINPKTGEILALVSTPDYDPNASALEEKWASLVEEENSPLLSRATMGTYPPGSTFKIITSIAAISDGLKNETIEDTGKTVIDGMTINNYHGNAQGHLDMTKALTVSSNVYFSQLAMKIGAHDLLSTAKAAGFGEKIPFEIPLKQSSIGKSDMVKTELAATGIGQGKLLATPLQMALVSSGVANEGTIMSPYLVSAVVDCNGKVLQKVEGKVLYRLTDASTAQAVREMMVQVVKNGTAKKAAISGIKVAGKTGTAQNEKSILGEGYDHSWFVGFAPADDPQIAVAVILEYDGKGGGVSAAPIGGKVMEQWLKK